jgi:chlorobactene glucosyltransferase
LPFYLLLSTGIFIASLAVIRWAHAQGGNTLIVERSESIFPSGEPPRLSLIVPARNEERNIRRCVESLLAQSYPDLEVIVLDDRSTDSTAMILAEIAGRDPRLKVLAGSDLPPGWAGKPYALHQAVAAARGQWLVFVDADTWLEPDALSATLATAIETGADLFTTIHHQVMDTFWERTVLPLVLLGLSTAFPPRKVNDPSRPQAVANGQYFLIRRGVYDAVGGHAAVRGEIVEDRAIAELVKRQGYRLLIADGRSFVNTRMYTSLPEMWEGWTKNIFLGLRHQPTLMALGVFGALLALLAALFLPVWPLLGWAAFLRGGGPSALAVILESLIVWGYLLCQRAKASHWFDIPAWYSLTLPLGSAIFAAMMFASAWKVRSGRGVTWKGRTYR